MDQITYQVLMDELIAYQRFCEEMTNNAALFFFYSHTSLLH